MVVRSDAFTGPRIVAGIDVAYGKESDTVVGAVALYDRSSRRLIEEHVAVGTVTFPYIPGLFSFRELPIIDRILGDLSVRPDMIVCDGQGIAHPRRCGLACHVGVLYDIPTIGCAKSRLIGTSALPAAPRGSSAPLIDGEEEIGAVLRTQDDVRPIYVSTGHRVSTASACAILLDLCSDYRLPDVIRHADRIGRERLKEVADA